MNLFARAKTNENLPNPVPMRDGSMFDGLSRREIIGWSACLALAVGLTMFGGANLAASLMSADALDVLKIF
jgi:hypothetical protein